MDLRERLEQKITEREQIAKGAWVNNNDASMDWAKSDGTHGWRVLDAEGVPVAYGLSEYDADHMALHDPADALAEVEHMRGILARHQIADPFRSFCGAHESELWPCAEIRALARRLGVEAGEQS